MVQAFLAQNRHFHNTQLEIYLKGLLVVFDIG